MRRWSRRQCAWHKPAAIHPFRDQILTNDNIPHQSAETLQHPLSEWMLQRFSFSSAAFLLRAKAQSAECSVQVWKKEGTVSPARISAHTLTRFILFNLCNSKRKVKVGYFPVSPPEPPHPDRPRLPSVSTRLIKKSCAAAATCCFSSVLSA